MTLHARRLSLSLMMSLALAALAAMTPPAPRLRAEERPESPKAADTSKKAREKGLPLTPDRTIEFTTEEGTWVSLDVSPDGKTIVFDLLGDLYTMPVEGGEAKPIVTGPAFDSQPRFSPDGKQLAFVSDRDGAENLWIAQADGSDPRALSKNKQSLYTSPSWTPDGDYVLVSRQEQAPAAPSSCGCTTPREARGFR